MDAFSEVRSGKGLEIVLRNKVKVRSRYLPPIFIDVEDYICETIYTLVPSFSLILAQASLLMEQWLLYLFPLAIVGQSRQSRLLWRDVPLESNGGLLTARLKKVPNFGFHIIV